MVEHSPSAGIAQRISDTAAVGMEALVCVIVCLSPWFFGAVDPLFRGGMFIGIAALACLWGLRMVLLRRVVWTACPTVFCIIVLFGIGISQLTPLSDSMLHSIGWSQAEMYESLVPTTQETLLGTQPTEATARLASRPSTISFNADATRTWLVNLLAVFVLFAICRTEPCLSSPPAIGRFCTATMLTGAALSLFGLVQFFGSPEGVIYQRFESDGVPFGPFVNCNHFAFYVNICIGMCIAMLLANRGDDDTYGPSQRGNLLDPRVLMIIGCLAIMICAVTFTLSRGGFIALLGAGAIFVFQLRRTKMQLNRMHGALLVGSAAAFGLLVWFGLDPIVDRFSNVLSGNAYAEASTRHGGRVFLLMQAWPVVSRFPLLGTGFGTFQFVEPLWFHTTESMGAYYVHAHNDYLEDLIEGGVPRLAVRLLFILIVFVYANKAIRSKDTYRQSAALGFTFSFATIVIHSFFDFGLHLPAIAAIAAVVTALLCRLGDEAAETTVNATSDEVFRGITPFLGVVIAVALACFLTAEGVRDAQVDHMRVEALSRRDLALAGSGSHGDAIPILQQALLLKPNDGELNILMAEAKFGVRQQQGDAKESPEYQRLTVEALRRVLRARQLCPILPTPHMRLAANTANLATSDSPLEYLRRAQSLAPSDPQLWYFIGLQQLKENQIDDARESWKRSLELSPQRVANIMDRASVVCTPAQLLEMLPDDAETIVEAVDHLFPSSDAIDFRAPFLRRAMDLLEKSSVALSPRQLRIQAKMYDEMEQPNEAIKALQSALLIEPHQVAWRYALAKLLYDEGQLSAASREVRRVLGSDPDHEAAKNLAALIAETKAGL